MRCEVVALTRIAAIAASSSAKSSHLEPSRVLPERRLPADWSLPGHWPAHDARCRGVAKLEVVPSVVELRDGGPGVMVRRWRA